MANKPVITLSRRELVDIVILACERHISKKDIGSPYNRRDNSSTGIKDDAVGLIGEAAVAQYLTVPFNADILNRGDGGIDLVFRGYTIDVKTTPRRDGRLVFNTLAEFEANLAVLVTVDEEWNCTLAGVISQLGFKREHYEKDLGFGLKVMVDQSALYNVSRLLTLPNGGQ